MGNVGGKVGIGPGEGDGFTVGGCDDCAHQIGTEDGDLRIPQAGEGRFVGMAVFILIAAGDDAPSGSHFPQKPVAGGGLAAVVADLQHIGVPVKILAPVVQHVTLSQLLHIAGKEKSAFSEFHH